MDRAGCLAFTLSSFVALAPATAHAQAPEPEPEPTPAPTPEPEPTPAPAAEPAPERAPSPSPPPDSADTGGPRPRTHLLFGLEGGYVAQSLYDVSITGMGFAAVLGASADNLSVGGLFTFERGWTQEGLQTTNVEAGVLIEDRIERFRIGGGLRIGTFDVSRVTGTTPLLSLSAGAFFRLSFDVATFGKNDRGALYLLGQASIDSVDAPLYGASLGLGVRL